MLSFLIISALSLVLLLSLIPFLINQKHIFHWWDSNRQSSDVNPFEVVAQTLWLLSHNLVLSTKRFDNSFQLDQELFLSLEQQKGQQVNDLPKLYGCVVIIQLMTVWCRAVISFLVFCTSGSFMFFSLILGHKSLKKQIVEKAITMLKICQLRNFFIYLLCLKEKRNTHRYKCKR